MVSLAEKFGKWFSGKSKSKRQGLQKRHLQMEPLEERQLLAVVTLEGTKLNAYEASTSTEANWGIVTFTRDVAESQALNVSFKLDGTATASNYSGGDYQVYTSAGSMVYLSSTYDYTQQKYIYTGTATIPANQTSTTLQIRPYNDSYYEGTETAIVQIQSSSSYTLGTNTSATVSIADNDNWTVNVTATDNVGKETNSGETADPIVFRFTRSGETDLSQSMTVYYQLAGTATRSTDYNLSTGYYDSSSNYGYVTIPANQTSVDLTLNIVNDEVPESTETVQLTLLDKPTNASSTTPVYYAIGTQNTGSATIQDNDVSWTIGVSATDATGTEKKSTDTQDPIIFRFTRNGSTDTSQPKTVYYRLSGTATRGSDYNPSTGSYDSYYDYGSVTIPAGLTYVDLTMNIVNDSFKESTETVILTLLNQPAYNGTGACYTIGPQGSVTGSIIDNDNWTVNLSVTDATAAEFPTDYGRFTVTRTGETDTSQPTTVYFRMKGTATPNTDYQLYTASGSYISMSNTYDSASGQYFYTGSFQIPANQTSTYVELRPINDSIFEPNETAIMELTPGTAPNIYYTLGTSTTGTVTITDNDNWTINVQATDAVGAEKKTGEIADPIVFRFSRSGETDLSQTFTVYYRLTGTATYGTDYSISTGSYSTGTYNYGTITIPANQTYVDLTLNITNDSLMEPDETVILTILDRAGNAPAGSSAAYTVGASSTVTAKILDNDDWTVDVVATDASGKETKSGETVDPITFKFTRSGSTDIGQAMTVYFNLSGTATYSSDYTLSTGYYDTTNKYGYVTIPANQTFVELKLNITNDAVTEPTESVVLTLLDKSPTSGSSAYPNYHLGTTKPVTASILDNDQWLINVQTVTASGKETKTGETAKPVVFRFTRSGETDLSQAMTVYYNFSGTATYDQDFKLASGYYNTSSRYGSVVIPANQTSVDITLNVIDDTLMEGTETIILNVLNDSPYTSDKLPRYKLGSTPSATGTIEDNEICWTVNLQAQTAYAAETNTGETAKPAVFRFTRSGSTDLTQSLKVYYTLSGTATRGSDYQDPPNYTYDYNSGKYQGYVTIPAGQTYADLTINITNDTLQEEAETIIATLAFPGSTSADVYKSGDQPNATVTLSDNDTPMQISVDGPYQVEEGKTIVLDAKKTFDPYGAGTWTFSWDLDGDGVFGETGTAAKNGVETGASVTFSATGLNGPITKTVSVKAVDEQGHTVTVSVPIDILNARPEIILNGPSSGNANTNYTWPGSFIDGGMETWTGTVDYGDGTGVQNVTLSANKTFNLTHKYTANGIYTITMSVNDGESTSFITKRVMIGNIAPKLEVKLANSPQPPIISNQIVSSFPTVEFGTETTLSFVIKNTGLSELTLDVLESLPLPKGVTFYQIPTDALAPGEETTLELRWDAMASSVSGTVRITTNIESSPVFLLKFNGISTALTNGPVVSEFKLLSDTGSSSTDKITYNPIVSGKLDGNFAGGSVRLEFDHNNDGVVDGYREIWNTGGTFTYDPSTDMTWPQPTSGTQAVALRYRIVHLDDAGTTLSTKAWNTFNYTLQPAPAGTLTVSNLKTEKGNGGDWSTAGAAAISGTVSGSGTRYVEIMINDNMNTRIVATVDGYGRFKANLQAGLEYGTAATIKVRALSYSTTEKMNIAGAWTSLSVTPTPPAVTSFGLKNGASNGTSSDVTLSGSLDYNAWDREAAEVEIYSGSTVYGRCWTDENGYFTVLPKNLPVVDGVATATLYARVVKTKSNGTAVYGTAKSAFVKYTPAKPSYIAYNGITLDNPKTTGGTITTDPGVTAKSNAAIGTDLMFEFSWKTTGDWSTPEMSQGYTTKNVSTTQDEYAASYRITGLHTISTDTAAVSLRARTAVWDSVQGGYVYSDWATYNFTYEKPRDLPASVDTFELETVIDAATNTTNDPAVKGKITNDTGLAGLTVEIYNGTVLLGTTVTDENGQFSFRPTTLTPGAYTLTAKVKEWNSVTQAYQYSVIKTLVFTLQQKTVPAPVIKSIALGDPIGTPSENKTANPYLVGKLESDGESLERVLVEFSHAGNGTVNGSTFTESDGTFRYSPTLSPGSYSMKVRASRWNTSTSQWVVGSWTTMTFTVVAKSANWVPTVSSVTTAFGTPNTSGTMVTDDPAIKGQLTSEGGFANLLVQYDLDGNGTIENEAAPDQWGRFAWRPTITLPVSGEKNVTIKVRAGKVDPNTGAKTWGAWTTYNYIYKLDGPATSKLDMVTIVQTSGYQPETSHIISGNVTKGFLASSVYVELDYQGDGEADGHAVPNSLGQFTFTATPDKSTIRARVVEILADGTKSYPTQSWETLNIVVTPVSGTNSNPQIILVPLEEMERTDVVFKVTGTTSPTSCSVAIDFDGDGTADITLSPDAQGRITLAMIDAKLDGSYSSTTVREKLASGLVLATVKLSVSGTVKSEAVLPYLNKSGLTSAELTTAKTDRNNYYSLLGSLQTSTENAVNGTTEIVTQQTNEPTIPGSSTQGSGTEGSLTGVTSKDMEKLMGINIPSIPAPNLDGQTVNIENDPTYKDAVKKLNDDYQAAAKAAKEAFQTGYDQAVDAYNTAVGKAWKAYSEAYNKLAKQYDELSKTAFSSTEEYKNITAGHNERVQTINQQKTAKQTANTAAQSSENTALSEARTSELNGTHDSNCNYYGHSDACSDSQSAIWHKYNKKSMELSAKYNKKRVDVDADYEESLSAENAKYVTAMVAAKAAFETKKIDSLLQIVEQMADLRKTYDDATAAATKTVLIAIAGKTETYRNSLATAWGTSVTKVYDEALKVLNKWKGTAGTDAPWASYVIQVVTNAKTEATSVVNAYKTQVAAEAAAEKTASTAIANASYSRSISISALRASSSKDTARRDATLQKEKHNAAKDYEIAVVTKRNETVKAEVPLWRSTMKTMIDQSLDCQKSVADTNHNCSMANTRLYRSYLKGNTTYESYQTQSAKNSKDANEANASRCASFDKAWMSTYKSFHLNILGKGTDFSNFVASEYEKYENKLIDALGVYWKTSITIGVEIDSSLLSADSGFAGSVNTASSSYSTALKNAENSFDTTSINAAKTRSQADDTAGTSWMNGVMNTFFATATSAYASLTGAAKTYLTSNLNAGKTLYNAETSNGTTLFTGLLNSAVASMTGSLNAGMGLVGDVLSGAATYASSFNSGSMSIESGAITTSKNLSTQEIDARIKYYKAVSKADKTRKDASITIDADRRKTEINIVYAAARDKIDERLNDDEYYYYSYYTGHYAAGVQVYLGQYTYDYDYDYGYGIGYFDGSYYYGSSTYYYPVMGSSYGSTTSYYFGGYYSGGYPVYGLYAGTNTDLPQIKANNDWAALKNLGADAVQTASKLAAKATYTTTYMGIYRSSVSAAWNVAGQYLDLDISTATTLDDKLWNDCSTANNALISTARADNSLGSMISSAKTSVSNEVNYSKSSGSNFGQYQVNWRQELATANPGNTALQQDVIWAQNIKSARDTYYSLLGTATIDYTGTVFDAVEDYSDTMFEAGVTRSQGHFNNTRTYSTTVRNAGNTYSRASFNASKDASLGYLDAAIAEIVGVANEEARQAADKSSRITGRIKEVTPGNGGTNSGTGGNNTTTMPYTNATTLLATVRSDSNTQDANDRTKLTQKKNELATERSKKEKEVLDRYTKAEQSAWNSYNNSVIAAQTTYANQYKSIETTYQNTAKAAENTYTTTVVTAENEYNDEVCRLTGRFYDAIGAINSGGTVTGNFFANGTSSVDVQVCFVAGTKIKLADGTVKNIEDLVVGDKVRTADQHNPEGELRECEIIEVYHNDPQPVWRLQIRNQETGKTLELRVTEEHPFYVPGKGWAQVRVLQIGDIFLNAKGDQSLVLMEKEFESDSVPVYNFQVKDAHTYFVGETDSESVLVHNACGDDTIGGYFSNVGKTLKGMVWTGPKRLVVGVYSAGKAVVTHPVQTSQNVYFGAGEVIYNTSTTVYNTGSAFYNDPVATTIELKDKAVTGVYNGANYALDNPEEVGATYFDAAASVVGGKAIQSGSKFIKGTASIANKVDDIKAAAKIDDLATAASKTKQLSHSDITTILKGYTDDAAAKFDANPSKYLTPKQLNAQTLNERLAPAFRGNRIDNMVRKSVKNDPLLDFLEGSPNKGPDFYNPANNDWWDITTPNQWQKHMDKYAPKYGPNGTILPTQ